MKGLFYGTVHLLAIASAIAVPASAPEAEKAVAPVEERNLFNLWVYPLHFLRQYLANHSKNPGYKPYKYKLYCPGKPAHQKYLCEKPSPDGYPSYLGYQSPDQKDFQYYLYPGLGSYYGYNEYTGGNTPNPKPREVCLAGPQGYEYISPVYNPPTYKFPEGWTYKYKQWVISPIYKILVWLEITLSYFKQVHYWQPPQGYKWICYDDGKGGYDVKVRSNITQNTVCIEA